MEIEITFIVEAENSYAADRRFVKVYLSKGRYFMQLAQGAIKEISDNEFNILSDKT